ncbi:hypothetical protein PMAYCL1PPCAC_03132 [Pristionchus mayeri]|uniref:Fatty-acid and retinol-binding protein 1 n=1 Tax=Pristionchus mayeri TaxID=1317129 RepID=A0AAN4Z7U2_9BILA|nr:hypothetical protein PMAYCL1PPCAC_03132 [Pristionchus mayeri]
MMCRLLCLLAVVSVSFACISYDDEIKLTKEEKAAIESETEALADLSGKFTKRDEVLKLIKEHAPKTYYILMKRVAVYQKYMPKVDAEAQKFVREYGNFLLEDVVIISKAKVDDDFTGMVIELAYAYKQVLSHFKALPQSSKDALEKTFCINEASREENNAKLESLMKSAIFDL